MSHARAGADRSLRERVRGVLATRLLLAWADEDIPGVYISKRALSEWGLGILYISVVQKDEWIVGVFGSDDGDAHGDADY